MGSNSHFVPKDSKIEKEVRKRSGFNLQHESSKKQKLDEQTAEEGEAQADTDQEIEEMKLFVKIVPDEDIAIDVIPIATKPSVIVEYKIVKEGKINTYHIIRADGSTKRYTSMIKLLENVNREDLETLCKLVKDKHGNTRPEEDYERVLSNDIKVMFEPNIESEHAEIMNHVKKQLVRSQQGWADDLSRVLWVHRTLPRNSQNETTFTLTYGSEAIIPTTVSHINENKEPVGGEKAKRKFWGLLDMRAAQDACGICYDINK
nr:hypothetical protein [Tanacetum cinerariifolium]